MGSEKSLLWAICLVLMIFVVVTLVDYILIIHTKIIFDRECQDIFWICEQNSGLLQSEIDETKKLLEGMGYNNVVVEVPLQGSVSRGERVVFHITAHKTMTQRKALFDSEQTPMAFEYMRIFINRRIVN